FVAERRVEPAHRLDKAHARELVQIVRLRTPSVVPPRDRPDQPAVLLDQLRFRAAVARGRPLEQGAHITRHPSRSLSTLSMVTIVPLPGVERTRSLSVKLSMMVNPMPLRVSSPVVNMGCLACSTFSMPRPASLTLSS